MTSLKQSVYDSFDTFIWSETVLKSNFYKLIFSNDYSIF